MAISRRTVNAARYVLENLLPPALRDSALFLPLMYLAWGRKAPRYINFRNDVRTMSDADIAALYSAFTPIMGKTDLNRACIDRILREAVGETILDVGSGRGWLAVRLAEHLPGAAVVGVDMSLSAPPSAPSNVRFVEGWLGRLPFADKSQDTVVCTHTLEHVADFEGAVADLRRIARRRLIIVVPREREYRYPFNLHVQFFPYRHSLLNRLVPPAGRFLCELLHGDFYYREDLD
jgi:ubiquinone/menaquinone biosynthesis C-methylase UbiE